jgi:hypothetical protein
MAKLEVWAVKQIPNPAATPLLPKLQQTVSKAGI